MKRKAYKNFSKITLSALLSALMFFSFLPVFAAEPQKDYVAADWHFSKDAVESGTLESNDLAIRDQSGNENTLRLNGKHADKYLKFSDDKMYNGTGGSLEFNNEQKRVLGKGVEFITDDNAPINKETFKDGYTIELIYKLPENFAGDDAWMGLLSRKGKCETMHETKKCSMSLAISNCKELQFLTANEKDSHEMDAAWSISMDKGGVWYHFAIISDGKTISTFVNGCEAFRDYESDEMVGMLADPKDGRFVIGGYDNGVFNHRLRGALQEIRICKKPLAREDWLLPHPEETLGKFGENLPFTNLSKSSYNMIFLPDIQNATEFRPEVLNTSAKWLNENKALVNPAVIVSLGDIVNTYSDEKQWENAKAFYEILEEQRTPILQQPGNHDYGDNFYLDAFGPDSAFGKRQVERGVVYSPSGYSSYLTFDGGSYRYLVVNISMYHIDDKDERAWFENVLATHEKYPTIVTSHSFQNCGAAKPDEVSLSNLGHSVWEIVKKYNQCFLMISGHHHGAGEEVLKNDAGNSVYSVLADYQFSYNGGNAFYKFAEFDEVHNKIRLSTFSPYAATLKEEDRTFFDVNYMTGVGNYTVLDLNFANRFAGMKQSDDAENYKLLVEETKMNKTDTPTALFKNVKVIGDKDAHTVTPMNQNRWMPILLTLAIVVSLIIVAVILVKCRKRKKQNKESGK